MEEVHEENSKGRVNCEAEEQILIRLLHDLQLEQLPILGNSVTKSDELGCDTHSSLQFVVQHSK